jgi:hypothetical protein
MKKRLAALALLAIAVPAAAEDQLSLGTGFDFTTGKYGNTKSTDILYIPVTAKYVSDELTLKLTVPYISITGPGGVAYGIGRFGKITARTTTTTNSGLGDVIASAGHTVYSAGPLMLDLVGNIKFGTADANKGLGTGKNDYSAQIDGYYALNRTTLFGTAGYRIYGSPVDGVTLTNEPYGTIGANRKLNDKTSAGAMLDVAKSPSIYSGDQEELTVYVSQKIAADTKVQAHVMKGFSNGSPDTGIGAMIIGYF